MSILNISNVEQGSPEWFAIRELRLTGSHAQAISANGKGLMTYVREKMRKFYSHAEEVSYSDKNMELGIEREATADMLYCYKTGRETQTVGFVMRDDNVGVSPDRFVGDDGLVEIKCPTDKVYFDLLLDRVVQPKYDWQMQMQMLVCRRPWCDYVVYNPNFDEDLVIIRVMADEAKFKKLEAGFLSGEKEMIRIKNLYAKNSPAKVVLVEAPVKTESMLEIDI